MRTLSRFARAVAALALGGGVVGCGGGMAAPRSPLPSRVAVTDVSLDRGAWLVGDQTGVWKVLAESPSGPPERIGYMTARIHREVRGGPVFTMYEVTTLDREEVVGIIDSLGNATRFRPKRGGGIEKESVGNNTLPLSVGAIFDTVRPITLERTTERALAFEVLDKNNDGALDKTEFPRIADRISSPDRNGDGKVDPQEFDAVDRL